jgi:putative DNA primase/helicase
MLAGVSHIPIDNLDRPLDNALLTAAMTEAEVPIRIFQTLSDRVVPNIYTVTVTGNKIQLVKDLAGRFMQASIRSDSEDPELDVFAFDPVAWVVKNRPEMVMAALGILKAYIDAGRPTNAGTLGSFEDWNDDVRAALLWLEQPDPVTSMKDIKLADPNRTLLDRFLILLAKLFGGENKPAKATTQQLIDKASESHEKWGLTDEEKELREVLAEMCPGRGNELSLRKINHWLVTNSKVVVEGRHLTEDKDAHTKAHVWGVKVIK